MKLIGAYWRSIRQYLATPKGRHDAWDYACAIGIIGMTCLVVYMLMKAVGV